MKIQEVRKRKNLSQEAVSRIINISLKHYQNIEKGVSIPTVTIALAICEVFAVDPRAIDEWKDRKPPV